MNYDCQAWDRKTLLSYYNTGSIIMPAMTLYDPNQRRRALRAFMVKRSLKLTPWCVAASVTEGTLRAFLKGTTHSLQDQTYEKLADAAKVSAAVLRGERALVPVVHKVGAGAEVFPIDDHERGQGIGEIEAPPGSDDMTFAARVTGDSMYPAYRDGDVILYQRRPAGSSNKRLVGRDVVVQLTDERVFVKVLKYVNKTTATLGSHNAPDIDGATIEWAAPVKWVKRFDS